jgi:hypothetical protein
MEPFTECSGKKEQLMMRPTNDRKDVRSGMQQCDGWLPPVGLPMCLLLAILLKGFVLLSPRPIPDDEVSGFFTDSYWRK